MSVETTVGNVRKTSGWSMLWAILMFVCGILAISLPLGIVASRRPKLSEWILGVAGVVQTVPSLALLALMVVLALMPIALFRRRGVQNVKFVETF